MIVLSATELLSLFHRMLWMMSYIILIQQLTYGCTKKRTVRTYIASQVQWRSVGRHDFVGLLLLILFSNVGKRSSVVVPHGRWVAEEAIEIDRGGVPALAAALLLQLIVDLKERQRRHISSGVTRDPLSYAMGLTW